MRALTLPATVGVGFAAYRIARVIAHDKIGEPIRQRTYKASVEHGKAGQWLNALVTCPFCLGVWVSASSVAWYALTPDWGLALLAVPAAAGVAAILSAADLALTMYVEHHPL